jgi:outer membrane lipoprotein SlyB
LVDKGGDIQSTLLRVRHRGIFLKRFPIRFDSDQKGFGTIEGEGAGGILSQAAGAGFFVGTGKKKSATAMAGALMVHADNQAFEGKRGRVPGLRIDAMGKGRAIGKGRARL